MVAWAAESGGESLSLFLSRDGRFCLVRNEREEGEMYRVLAVVLAGLLLGGCVATDREKAGLRGKVKTVKTELAKVSTNPHNVEGIRNLLTQVTYDKKGVRLQNSCYWADKSATSSPVAFVDGTGQKLEVASSYKDGTVDSKLVSMFNTQGTQTEEILFDIDGSIGQRAIFQSGELRGMVGSVNSPKWVYTHDKQGHRLTKLLYDDADHTVLLKSTYTYDPKGRLVEVASYRDSAEVPLGKWAYEYDDKGQRAEAAFYGGKGQELCRWRFSYEVDRKSNWVRREAAYLLKKNNQTDWKPSEVVYRDIAYWKLWG